MLHKRKRQGNLFSLENDIKRLTVNNGFYRRVLHTGQHSQLVLMSVPPEGETGEHNEKDTDKILFIVKGTAASVLNKRTRKAGKRDMIFVPAGSLHNLINTGRHDLRLFVVYSPPLYADGTIHKTSEDALEARRNRFAYAWEL
jgi:mannose-6-phosphate isomerase-like protein (cupin superfamily)